MNAAPENTTSLSQRQIFKFFSPLALSWLFMALEGPISVSIISRLAEPKENTAAFNVLMALALLLESPIIDLLSTSTTLATTSQNYGVMRRFVYGLLVGATVVHAVFVFTPLYDFVAGPMLQLPPEVAEGARKGLGYMLLWSAFIGWRRFKQGILIRNGQTRWIGIGTVTRLTALVVVALITKSMGSFSGVEVAALAIISSVAAEALFIEFASRKTIAGLTSSPDGKATVTLRSLANFHFPLSATTFIMLGTQPLISRALSASPDPILALAGYQTSMSLGWMFRATLYALPELFITLGNNIANRAALKAFGLRTGLLTSGLIVFFVITGTDKFIFQTVYGAQPEVASLASFGFVLSCLLPLSAALQSYCRGMLTLAHQTKSRLVAIFVGMTTMVLMLQLGVSARWDGVFNALFATTIAHATELWVLYVIWRAYRDRSQIKEQAHH